MFLSPKASELEVDVTGERWIGNYKEYSRLSQCINCKWYFGITKLKVSPESANSGITYQIPIGRN